MPGPDAGRWDLAEAARRDAFRGDRHDRVPDLGDDRSQLGSGGIGRGGRAGGRGHSAWRAGGRCLAGGRSERAGHEGRRATGSQDGSQDRRAHDRAEAARPTASRRTAAGRWGGAIGRAGRPRGSRLVDRDRRRDRGRLVGRAERRDGAPVRWSPPTARPVPARRPRRTARRAPVRWSHPTGDRRWPVGRGGSEDRGRGGDRFGGGRRHGRRGERLGGGVAVMVEHRVLRS